jgi:hypothetical protein
VANNKPPIIIPGTYYGSLVTTGVYIPGYWNGNKKIPGKVECKCDCGSISYKQLATLKHCKISSCGRKCPYNDNKTHGLSMDKNGKTSKEYAAWYNMNRRCHNPKHIGYQDYGGRGITVHPEWRDSPKAFLEYIGKAPSHKHSVDRIDNDKGYEPGNVRWATSKEQIHNRRTISKKEDEIAFLKQLLRDNNIEYAEA